MVARRQRKNALVPPSLDDVPGRFQNVQPPDEAGSAYRPPLSRTTCNSLELFSQPRSVFTNRFEQRRIGEALQHVQGDCGYQRTAAKRGSVIPRLNCRSDLFRHENRTHWQPARQRLCQREHIGNNPASLVREHMSRSAESALDLVEDERDIPLGSDCPQFFKKTILEDSHSTLALNRLDNQSSARLLVACRLS